MTTNANSTVKPSIKDRLNLFVVIRILFGHLAKVNPRLLAQVKKVLKDCDAQKKNGNPEFQNLAIAMELHIRKAVGETHWNEALQLLATRKKVFARAKAKKEAKETPAPTSLPKPIAPAISPSPKPIRSSLANSKSSVAASASASAPIPAPIAAPAPSLAPNAYFFPPQSHLMSSAIPLQDHLSAAAFNAAIYANPSLCEPSSSSIFSILAPPQPSIQAIFASQLAQQQNQESMNPNLNSLNPHFTS